MYDLYSYEKQQEDIQGKFNYLYFKLSMNRYHGFWIFILMIREWYWWFNCIKVFLIKIIECSIFLLITSIIMKIEVYVFIFYVKIMSKLL